MYQFLPFFNRRRAILEMAIARNGFDGFRLDPFNRKEHIFAIREAILRARRERLGL